MYNPNFNRIYVCQRLIAKEIKNEGAIINNSALIVKTDGGKNRSNAIEYHPFHTRWWCHKRN